MAKRNGGIIGPANTPTASVAAGVWRLRDAFNSIKNGTWPLTRSLATNSLRFNPGSSDYLNRTSSSSPTNNKIATFSCWVKRSSLGSALNVDIFDQYTDGQNYAQIMFYQDNILVFQRDSTSNNIQLVTTQVFRDVSAWYHIVVAYDTTQATASNRVKLYVNGSQVTSFSTETYPSQNLALRINSSSLPLYIGTYSAGNYYSGYMSEIHFIDGQALTPSSFGASNSSGVWYPIAYQGTWGTNGFYLKFANSASLGTDSSGNGNNFTVNNLTSVDQSTDTELNNFATMNPLLVPTSNAGTFTEGNLSVQSASAGYFGGASTLGASKGKWYWEGKITAQTAASGHIGIDGDPAATAYSNTYSGNNAWSYGYNASGNKFNNGTGTSYGSSYTLNDILMIAMDLDNNYVYFGLNGTWQNSGVPTSGSSGTGAAFSISSSPPSGNYFIVTGDGGASNSVTFASNYGAGTTYAGNNYADGAGYGNFSYAVPSGYYALCTANLNTYG